MAEPVTQFTPGQQRAIEEALARRAARLAPPAQAQTGQAPIRPSPIAAYSADADRARMASQAAAQGPSTSRNIARSIILEGGGATAGQIAGLAGGPFAPITVPVFGAIGGGVGNILDQMARQKEGQQEGFRLGELLAAIGAGAIPGSGIGSVGKSVTSISRPALVQAFGKRAGLEAAGNLAAAETQALIDEGRTLTLQESLGVIGLTATGTVMAQRLDGPRAVRAFREQRGLDWLEAGKRKRLSDAGYTWLNGNEETLLAAAGPEKAIEAYRVRTQPVTQRLARGVLGAEGNSAIPERMFSDARRAAWRPYEDAVDIVGRERVAELKKSYRELQSLWKAGKTDEWAAKKSFIKSIENEVENAAKDAGAKGLVERLRDSRRQIARTYALESAYNHERGLINAFEVHKLRKAGVRLDGNLDLIADFGGLEPALASRMGKSTPFRTLDLIAETQKYGGGHKILGLTGIPSMSAQYLAERPGSSARSFTFPRQTPLAMASRLVPQAAARRYPSEQGR